MPPAAELTHSSTAGLVKRRGWQAWLVIVLLVALTAFVYAPSLLGGFVFDDGYYFVDNADVHVTSLQSGEWMRAALSQAGMNQFRALGMLSFAANYYFTGLDPFWLKATNLAIHLVNGLLLFLMLRNLLALRDSVALRRDAPAPNAAFVAAIIAGAWLLLPINLTAVAYVSQRLEALANLFVLLGLCLYTRYRLQLHELGTGGAQLWLALLLCTLLGLSAKESAALLPLYAACLEFAITGFRDSSHRLSKPVVWLHLCLLVVPFLAGLIWLSTWAFSGVSNFRQFSTLERLLTEARVLIDYIHWTLLPDLDALTFYHDDIAVSHGLLDPPTTLLAIFALLALLALALWQRQRRPLFCLGILWFFAGHSMTATIVPLELVFEHRNYFPSIGLLLAVAALLAIEPGIGRRRPAFAATVACLLLALFAFTTYLRAQEWSHPLRLAYSEALKRPQSSRAQYTLAHTLIASADSDDSPLLTQSMQVLRRDAMQPQSGIASLQALVYLAARRHEPIEQVWWETMTHRLREQTPSQTDIDAIIFLYHCQRRGDCPKQTAELLNLFGAALTKTHGNANLMAAYGEFALLELGDAALAERMYREVVAEHPQIATYRANLVEFLIATNQIAAAEGVLQELRAMNTLGSLDRVVSQLDAKLQATRSAAPHDGAQAPQDNPSTTLERAKPR